MLCVCLDAHLHTHVFVCKCAFRYTSVLSVHSCVWIFGLDIEIGPVVFQIRWDRVNVLDLILR